MANPVPGQAESPASIHSLSNLEALRFPVLVSVPHAGREYPPELLDNLNVPASHLLRLEDRYSDRLAAAAIASGFPAIIARKPRAWIDLNRNRSEIDPDMVIGMDPSQTGQMSRKVRGGLGLLPRRLHGAGNLWRNKWSHQHVVDRIEKDHEPYHLMVAHQLDRIRSTFGCALLLDLHSMPPVLDDNRRKIGFVLGDRFGRSCESRYVELAAEHFRRQGHSVQTNHPYSGSYILERHGNPSRNIHAFQLEVDRSLYLDSSMREPTAAAGSIAELIRNCCAMLAEQLTGQDQLEAAE
ncbi:N-formylglutamate amidohydrolase [Sphingopyxis sp. BSNA05]|uniref:N-formylglutamate amidohydrolase n=1 Tax=Sphingopyxis sp. BSNA05 TaxID=1236614 RepID=UPI001564DF15|nr:N-formylglutamate amidohydrolase [Sphingopyxis sp. BSNA05]NRD90424.1 N-formylglutamate amidohydrolase [Sphingopyxis sp. BSNA05]